jgi:hypothetical protein
MRDAAACNAWRKDRYRWLVNCLVAGRCDSRRILSEIRKVWCCWSTCSPLKYVRHALRNSRRNGKTRVPRIQFCLFPRSKTQRPRCWTTAGAPVCPRKELCPGGDVYAQHSCGHGVEETGATMYGTRTSMQLQGAVEDLM